MLVSAIVDAVLDNTKSPDHDDDSVLEIINRGLVEIAGGGDRQHGNAELAPLPNLLTFGVVTLGAGNLSVALPADYQRAVVRVEYSGGRIKRFDNFNLFMDAMASASGGLAGYCVKGMVLWVGPAQPSDVALTVYYHKKPESLQALPEHLQFPLLYHYASKEIFSEIEQGLEGAMPDTVKHEALYQKALTNLERIIGPADGDAINVGDDAYTEDMISI